MIAALYKMSSLGLWIPLPPLLWESQSSCSDTFRCFLSFSQISTAWLERNLQANGVSLETVDYFLFFYTFGRVIVQVAKIPVFPSIFDQI